MMDYSFVLRLDAEPYEGQVWDFPTDAAAIEAAATVAQAAIDFRPLAEGPIRAATVGVGRGALIESDGVVWLGEWALDVVADRWVWTPSPD